MVRRVLAGIVVAFGVTVFVAGAYTATQAMHPMRRKIAEVCPCMSHVSCSDAAIAGDQHAWYYVPDKANGGGVIVLHGSGGTREDMLALGAVFLRDGYSILVPDLRGHGQSGGVVTFGEREAHDTQQWAEWLLRQKGVSRLYGFGVSLGGSVLLESLDYEKRFRAVVAESAFADFPAIAQERMRRAMPGGFGWVTVPFVDSGLLWVRFRYGADLWHPSAVQAVARSGTPILVIHGLSDHETLPEHSREIAAANPATTELWLIPKAAHANAWATAGKVFEARVLGWYGSH